MSLPMLVSGVTVVTVTPRMSDGHIASGQHDFVVAFDSVDTSVYEIIINFTC